MTRSLWRRWHSLFTLNRRSGPTGSRLKSYRPRLESLECRTVPATFSLADSFERWLTPKFRRVITYRGPQDQGPGRAEPQPAE